MSASAKTVKPGDSVRISCTPSDFKPLELVEIYKYVDGTLDVKLSTNGILADRGDGHKAFPGSDRYKSSSVMMADNSTITVVIDITGTFILHPS